MTHVIVNDYTGEYDIVDSFTGEVVDSVCDRFAAQRLCAMYNEEG